MGKCAFVHTNAHGGEPEGVTEDIVPENTIAIAHPVVIGGCAVYMGFAIFAFCLMHPRKPLTTAWSIMKPCYRKVHRVSHLFVKPGNSILIHFDGIEVYSEAKKDRCHDARK